MTALPIFWNRCVYIGSEVVCVTIERCFKAFIIPTLEANYSYAPELKRVIVNEIAHHPVCVYIPKGVWVIFSGKNYPRGKRMTNFLPKEPLSFENSWFRANSRSGVGDFSLENLHLWTTERFLCWKPLPSPNPHPSHRLRRGCDSTVQGQQRTVLATRSQMVILGSLAALPIWNGRTIQKRDGFEKFDNHDQCRMLMMLHWVAQACKQRCAMSCVLNARKSEAM